MAQIISSVPRLPMAAGGANISSRTAPMLLRRQMTAAHHWKAGTATGCTFRQTVIPTHPCSGRSRCTANPASIWCPIPLDGLRSTPMICRTAAWKRIRTVRWIFSFPLTNRKRNWHGKTGCRRRKTEEHFSLALRVYTPDEQTIRGEWEPPVLERI